MSDQYHVAPPHVLGTGFQTRTCLRFVGLDCSTNESSTIRALDQNTSNPFSMSVGFEQADDSLGVSAQNNID